MDINEIMKQKEIGTVNKLYDDLLVIYEHINLGNAKLSDYVDVVRKQLYEHLKTYEEVFEINCITQLSPDNDKVLQIVFRRNRSPFINQYTQNVFLTDTRNEILDPYCLCIYLKDMDVICYLNSNRSDNLDVLRNEYHPEVMCRLTKGEPDDE